MFNLKSGHLVAIGALSGVLIVAVLVILVQTLLTPSPEVMTEIVREEVTRAVTVEVTRIVEVEVAATTVVAVTRVVTEAVEIEVTRTVNVTETVVITPAISMLDVMSTEPYSVATAANIEHVGFSPDGDYLVAGLDDNSVVIWALDEEGVPQADADPNFFYEIQDAAHFTVAFHPNGQWMASTGEPFVSVWPVDEEGVPNGEGQLKLGEDVYIAEVTALAYSPDGRWIVSGNSAGQLVLFPLGTDGTPVPDEAIVLDRIVSGTGTSFTIYAVAYNPESFSMVSTSSDHTIRIWLLDEDGVPQADSELERRIATNNGRYTGAVAFSPNGRWLATPVERSNLVQIILLDTNGLPAAETEAIILPEGRELEGSFVTALAYSPDGKWLAVGYLDGTIDVWSLGADSRPQPDKAPVTFRRYEADINTLAFSPDGQWLASGGADNAIRLWQLTK